jgi:YjbE family integral membrane protein
MMTLSSLGGELIALGKVMAIDLVLAGDNAIVVGMAAARLPVEMRRKVIFLGLSASTVLRILFALAANQIMAVIGLTLAGGILLLWVCWKFWRQLVQERRDKQAAEKTGAGEGCDGETSQACVAASMRQAVIQIVVADVSMSLDNVLAVAGAAVGHAIVMGFGLLLSIGLMGAAANLIARFLNRHPWLSYGGLAIIFWVSIDMIYRGGDQVIQKIALLQR